jgi:transposase-like protein
MTRSYTELLGLEFEAERLVRAGESRAEVSRRLGVHPTTLSGWALRGGWRKKDLDLERNPEITRKTILAIRDGNRAVNAQRDLRRQMAGFMREAIELLAAGDERSLSELERRLAGVAAPARLEAPEVALEAHAGGLGGGLGEARLGPDRGPEEPGEPEKA